MFRSKFLGAISPLVVYQQSTSIANTKHYSLVARSGQQKQPEYHQKFFGKFLSMKWRPVKTRKVLHVIAMQKSPFPVCGVLFIFFLNIMHLLKILFSAKHHMSAHKTASRKTSNDTTELEKKFSLHILLAVFHF